MAGDETKSGDPKVQIEATKFAIQQFVKRVTEITGIDPDQLISEADESGDFQFRQIDKESYEGLTDLQKALASLTYGLEESVRGEEYLVKYPATVPDFWRALSFLEHVEKSDDFHGFWRNEHPDVPFGNYISKHKSGVDADMVYYSGLETGRTGLVLTAEDLNLVKEFIGFDAEIHHRENSSVGGKKRMYATSSPYYKTKTPNLFVEQSRLIGTAANNAETVNFIVHQYDIGGYIDASTASGTQSSAGLVKTADPRHLYEGPVLS